MNGNICPQCGKDVMPYSRFLREAEPYKISTCRNCNTKLKRSPRVYLYLLIMCIILIAMSTPLFLAIEAAHISSIIFWLVLIVWLACWGLLINYLSWRYISWVVVEGKYK
jgi:uncharacterized protein (DUF983 family)